LSSILKALRKLEKDSPTHGDSHPHPVNVKQTVETGVKEKKNLYKIFFVLFAALLVFGSLFILSRKTVPKEKSTRVSYVRKQVLLRKKEEPVKIASVPASPAKKRKAALPKPQDRLKKRAIPPDSHQKELLSINKTGKDTPPSIKNRMRKVKGPTLPFKSAGSSGLKLQAIAWNSDPKQRITVVNGRILREGSSIEGALVIHIDKNDVSFQKGDEQWRQKFGPQ